MGKKKVFAAVALAALSVTLVLVFAFRGQGRDRPWYELGMMGDDVLDQVLLFYLGEAWTGMTDTGEILETAGRVDVRDPYSWAREWRKTAERLDRAALETEQAGHELSAGELSLRAASYYRASLHRHMEPSSPEVAELAGKEVAAFCRAMRLLGLPVERVAIPYEDTTLAAYWYCRGDGVARPVIIAHQGRDAWAEDNFFIGREALRRGYNCLIVDGPGQGSTLRLQGLPFRPDWERVIAPAVDWLVARSDVDPGSIGLIGMSMGGALAPRAASFEHRLAFLVANPGVSNWSATFSRSLNEISPLFGKLAENNPRLLNRVMTFVGRVSPFLRWGIVDTMWKHGVDTPAELLSDMKRYDASADISLISCPTLVVDAEAEEYGDAMVFYDMLNCPKTYMLFTAEEAAPLHVQTASIALGSQRIFDWIDQLLSKR